MAIDYINVDRSKQLGNNTVRAAELILELRALVDKLNDSVGRMNDGSNYTAVETNFGIGSGKGANFATLMLQIHEIFNTATEVTGANRLARIDEFCARLAGQ